MQGPPRVDDGGELIIFGDYHPKKRNLGSSEGFSCRCRCLRSRKFLPVRIENIHLRNGVEGLARGRLLESHGWGCRVWFGLPLFSRIPLGGHSPGGRPGFIILVPQDENDKEKKDTKNPVP
jgi:hypothetical protein